MSSNMEDLIINETRKFVDTIATLNHIVASTNDQQLTRLIHKLRLIEQRLSLIYTFFMASSYSNTIRQQVEEEQDKSYNNNNNNNTNRPPFQ
ncbi:hypothetical protein INT45_006558 [Circinella minor]|uniref:Uncharacterized protein n=1 Tax=Circinella minor TaxID=1195481 RepID=A0A8H7VIQ7_9FUNG|nr:hypothetical protein INT45_006558 [Circinella minor]